MSKEAMKRITRDDTEHGVEYYRADEVDALLAEQPAPVREDWGPGPHEYHSLPAQHAVSVCSTHDSVCDDPFAEIYGEVKKGTEVYTVPSPQRQPLPDGIASPDELEALSDGNDGMLLNEDFPDKLDRLARWLREYAASAQQKPVLVRDAAEVLGVSVPEVSAALMKMGHWPRSTNMAISGEELLAVAAALRAEQPAQQQDTMTVQEVWVAAGGNPGMRATKQDVLDALKLLDEVCEEADRKPAQQEPVTDEENERFSRDVSNFKGTDEAATMYALEKFLKGRRAEQPVHQHEEPCKHCHGEGVDGEDGDGIVSGVTWQCEACNGTGKEQPAQRKPLPKEQLHGLIGDAAVLIGKEFEEDFFAAASKLIRMAEAAHDIKEQP